MKEHEPIGSRLQEKTERLRNPNPGGDSPSIGVSLPLFSLEVKMNQQQQTAKPHVCSATPIGKAQKVFLDKECETFNLRKGKTGDITVVESWVSVTNTEMAGKSDAENAPKHGKKPQIRHIFFGVEDGEVLPLLGQKKLKEDKKSGLPYICYNHVGGGGQMARLTLDEIDNPEMIIAAAESYVEQDEAELAFED
jgi:hypothetical protein